jgi:hypothetical protein
LELRLRATERPSLPRHAIAGSIVGRARDTAIFSPAVDVQMMFPVATRVEGFAEPAVLVASGAIRGEVTVSDSENNASTCTYVEFELTPRRGQ